MFAEGSWNYVPHMRPYIEFVGTLQNSGLWLVKVTTNTILRVLFEVRVSDKLSYMGNVRPDNW